MKTSIEKIKNNKFLVILLIVLIIVMGILVIYGSSNNDKKMIETLFSITINTEFNTNNIKNNSISTKILDYSNSENGFINGIYYLDLEDDNLYLIENKRQIIDGNITNSKYEISKIKSNKYNNKKTTVYQSSGNASCLFVKDNKIYFVEQISTLNKNNNFVLTTNLKSYDIKKQSENTIKTLKVVGDRGRFINEIYLDKKSNIIYYSTSNNKLYSISIDGSKEKLISGDCNRMTTRGGLLVYSESNSENYLLYGNDFKKISSLDVWAYKNGYIYSSGNNIVYYDGKKEKNIYSDSKSYSIKYLDGNNSVMLIVDNNGYGEGTDYKKINLTDYSVNNEEYSYESFIRTIEYK